MSILVLLALAARILWILIDLARIALLLLMRAKRLFLLIIIILCLLAFSFFKAIALCLIKTRLLLSQSIRR